MLPYRAGPHRQSLNPIWFQPFRASVPNASGSLLYVMGMVDAIPRHQLCPHGRLIKLSLTCSGSNRTGAALLIVLSVLESSARPAMR